MFKVLFSTITRHIDNGTLQLKILRTWINVRANSFLGTKYYETIMGEGAWEVISGQKSEPALRRTLH